MADSAAVGCWRQAFGLVLTGRGYSLGIIDDPVRDQQDAKPDGGEKVSKAWYRSGGRRQTPTAAMVIVQTRWHEGFSGLAVGGGATP